MTADVIVDIFVAADGWAGSNGLPAYFGYLGPELEQWFTAEGAAPHIDVMGRRTFDMLSGLPEEYRDDEWRRMAEHETVVVSRTLREPAWPNTRVVAGPVADTMGRIKAESDVPLRTVGSLSVAHQLLESGLVDRIRLMTFPLFAGPAGREPFFEKLPSLALELVDSRVLDGRIVLTEYRPTGRDIPRV